MADEKIVVIATKDAADAIIGDINTIPGSQSQMTDRRNLDGDVATWIVVATLASQALPHVLSFITGIVGGGKVRRIKIGDWEVENPTPAIIEQFTAAMRRRHDEQ